MNEPLVDTAIVSESFAPSPELEGVLLESASAGAVDDVLRARLLLLRLLSRLYWFLEGADAPGFDAALARVS